MSHFMGAGTIWVGLNPTDLDCWQFTLFRSYPNFFNLVKACTWEIDDQQCSENGATIIYSSYN